MTSSQLRLPGSRTSPGPARATKMRQMGKRSEGLVRRGHENAYYTLCTLMHIIHLETVTRLGPRRRKGAVRNLEGARCREEQSSG